MRAGCKPQRSDTVAAVTDSSNLSFRFHPASSVRDAVGIVQMSAASMAQGMAMSGVGDRDRLSGESVSSLHQGAAGSESTVCFVRDLDPIETLCQIWQAIHCHVPFCVIPENLAAADIAASDAAAWPVDDKGLAIAGQPQFQCLSSGTSGAARRIQRSHLSWIKSFAVNASLLQVSVKDRYAIVGHLSHSLPLYAALEACSLGADIQMLGELRPDRQLAALYAQGTTVLYVTPTQARQLSRVRSSGPHRPSELRYVLCGGGKLDDKTRMALLALFPGASVLEFYGASEASFITMSTEQTPSGSVGRAYPGVSLKILDEHDETTAGIGEIWVKSPYLFSGYAGGDWRDTRLLNGYLSIGEMGEMDEAGNLFLRGRKSRQANVADTRVYLEEMENRLLQHPAVHHCVVVTQQDVMRGETLVAVVEGCDDEALRAELLKYARQQFGAILAPRNVLFVDALPYLAAGKPDVRQVQALVESR